MKRTDKIFKQSNRMEVFKPKVFGLRDLPKATSNLRKVDLGISVYRTILALFDAMFLFFHII